MEAGITGDGIGRLCDQLCSAAAAGKIERDLGRWLRRSQIDRPVGRKKLDRGQTPRVEAVSSESILTSNSGRDPHGYGPNDAGDPKDEAPDENLPVEKYVLDETAIDGFPTLEGDFAPKLIAETPSAPIEADPTGGTAPRQKATESSDVDKWLDEWLDDEAETQSFEPAQPDKMGSRGDQRLADSSPPSAADVSKAMQAVKRAGQRGYGQSSGPVEVAGRRATRHQESNLNEHGARFQDRPHSGKNQRSASTASVESAKSSLRLSKQFVSVVAICLVLALTGGVVYAMANRSEPEKSDRAISAGAASRSDEDTVELPVAGPAAQGIKELAASTVRVIGLNDAQQPECAGSGIIVESDGTILTNAHVVTSGSTCSFSTIGIAVTSDTSDPAELRYLAEVVAVNSELDLAVIRIAEAIDGQPIPEEFPVARLGNSESVALGDPIRILGYPVIGGDTITFTTGAVSGFSSQEGIGNRAFIKTDATISAGNSGGMAVDVNGLVVGISSKARGSESGPAVDCRPVDDTNDDGIVDDGDLCVSVGGFLNGIRPINLAKPILSEVEFGRSLAISVLEENSATATFDMSGVTFEAPRFSLGEKGNVPRRAVDTLSSDADELCLFVNWSGVPDGTKWDGLWYVDGELAKEHSSFDQEWSFGETGENFWMCVLSENEPDESVDGIRPGLYEVGFFLEGQLVFAEGIEVTPDPVETYDVGWSNDTGEDLCGLAVNPESASQQVGLNELDPGARIKPGEGIVLRLPEGPVVVEAYACDGEVIAGEYGGINITRSETFVIGL